MELEQDDNDFWFDEDVNSWEISDNRFLVNLMTERASFIIEIFEDFLRKKGFKLFDEEEIAKSTDDSMHEVIRDQLEQLLIEARGEFEEEVIQG